jgi:hypothetical protein
MPNPFDSLPKCSGIYKIQCLQTNYCYVGKAKNMYNRQCGHITCLNNDKHSNKRLAEVFRTHKRRGLAFSVLEECLPEQLNLKELEWAYLLNPELNQQWVEAFKNPYYSEKRSYFSEKLGLWLSWSTGEQFSFAPKELGECERVGSFYIPRPELPLKLPQEVASQALELWMRG